MKHKPVLMAKIKFEQREEKQIVSGISSTETIKSSGYFDDIVIQGPKKINNEDSFLLYLSQGFFKIIKAVFTRHIYILVILYFILRWLGFDIYPPFGDFLTGLFNKAWLYIQSYFKKELN